MSCYEEGSEYWPHHICGQVIRTSGAISEDGAYCAYLHLADGGRRGKRDEAPLTFRISQEVGLGGLMAKSGDLVYIEWIPNDCKTIAGHAGPVVSATKFHLSRPVAKAYGSGFDKPDWYIGSTL